MSLGLHPTAKTTCKLHLKIFFAITSSCGEHLVNPIVNRKSRLSITPLYLRALWFKVRNINLLHKATHCGFPNVFSYENKKIVTIQYTKALSALEDFECLFLLSHLGGVKATQCSNSNMHSQNIWQQKI